MNLSRQSSSPVVEFLSHLQARLTVREAHTVLASALRRRVLSPLGARLLGGSGARWINAGLVSSSASASPDDADPAGKLASDLATYARQKYRSGDRDAAAGVLEHGADMVLRVGSGPAVDAAASRARLAWALMQAVRTRHTFPGISPRSTPPRKSNNPSWMLPTNSPPTLPPPTIPPPIHRMPASSRTRRTPSPTRVHPRTHRAHPWTASRHTSRQRSTPPGRSPPGHQRHRRSPTRSASWTFTSTPPIPPHPKRDPRRTHTPLSCASQPWARGARRRWRRATPPRRMPRRERSSSGPSDPRTNQTMTRHRAWSFLEPIRSPPRR